MKIIFHSCIDGYITELQFEENQSRIFWTMQDCFEYAKTFLEDVKQIPQERLEHQCYKWELEQEIHKEREVEEDAVLQ